MKNKIYMSEMVENKGRKFGEAPDYIPVVYVMADGTEKPGLLTWGDVQKTCDRAAKNPEDIPGGKSVWELLFGKRGE